MAMEAARTARHTSNWPAVSYVVADGAAAAAGEESGDGAVDFPEPVHDGGQHNKEHDEQEKGREEIFWVSDHCGDPPPTCRYVFPVRRKVANFAPSWVRRCRT
jgi:hypothetical protein